MEGGRWKLKGGGLRLVMSISAAALGFAFASELLRAECLSLASGPVVYDVSGCSALEPEKVFDPAKARFKFIGDLDAVGRRQLLDSYRGLYLKGKVVKSNASNKGVTNDQGVLMGEEVFFFVPPAAGNLQCQAVLGKRLSAQMRERCCDGGGEAPCLLNTGYSIVDVKVLGSAESGAGDAQRQRSARSKDYQTAEKHFLGKKYKLAAASYEKAQSNGDLDVKGQYYLGFSYREIDQCKDAIRPLRAIYEASLKKQIWADDEKYARPANFLLARCYAKLNEPGAAVHVLNGYLLEPEKYRSELGESLRHKDFGWIHTSRDFRDYVKAANKKLSSLRK